MAANRVAIVAVLLLTACSGGSGPSDGLAAALDDVAAAHDAYLEKHGEYPDPFSLDQTDLDQQILEDWNVVVYYGAYGYCIEGDDEDGSTWHLGRDDGDPAAGECPES